MSFIEQKYKGFRHKLYLYKKYYSIIGKHIFIIGEPRHGNMGDNAIAEAQKTFIYDAFNGKCIISDVFRDDYDYDYDIWDKVIKKKDIICLVGGGNLGDLWYEEELFREGIINRFPDNRIIIFPQSMLFNSQEKFECAKKVYNGHKNLTVVARDKYSYASMKESFSDCEVLLTPDIVLSLSGLFNQYVNSPRENIGLFMRKDIERNIDDPDYNKLIDYLDQNGYKYDLRDMVDPISITIENRKELINKKFECISHYRLIITDRLHAMVFSALTGTPCIVLGNNHHKVKGCYEWIDSLEYIHLVNNIDEAILLIDNLYDFQGKKQQIDLRNEFAPLMNALIKK